MPEPGSTSNCRMKTSRIASCAAIARNFRASIHASAGRAHLGRAAWSGGPFMVAADSDISLFSGAIVTSGALPLDSRIREHHANSRDRSQSILNYSSVECLRPITQSILAPVPNMIRRKHGEIVLAVTLAAGAGLRIWQYTGSGSLWLDEIMLSRSIVGFRLPTLLTVPLPYNQVAPKG